MVDCLVIWLDGFFRQEILWAASEDFGEVVEVTKIIVSRIVFALYFADKTNRHTQFIGKVGLRKAVFDPFLFHPLYYVTVYFGFQYCLV